MKYKFNQAIKSQLKSFSFHLKIKGYSAATIKQKTNYAGYFLSWTESERLTPETTRYTDMMSFMDHCRTNNFSKKHINTVLLSVRNYFDYLKTETPELINPATNLKVKGETRKVPNASINYSTLEKLYNDFETTDNRSKRNKTMLGLLIYQGVTTEELKQLETSHVKLNQGTIFIPGNRKRNSRTLALKPFQILELHEYINHVRPTIINEINQPKSARHACQSGRKPNKINHERLKDQLFISINGSEQIKTSLFHMFRTIRKTHPEIQNAKQIRAAVIIYWLKTHNLRQVQYMAGHKYVSSTERYKINSLENLQKNLEEYHPLN
jgi:integrase/recombinase XerD